MAGFGFSPQDIYQGISVSRRIFEAHFVRERRADVRFIQFGIEIRSLGTVLEHLQDRLANAAQKYQDQAQLRQGTALCDPKDAQLEAERRSLVGDFRRTLRECEAVLAEHSSFLRDPSTFLQNVKWELRTQQKIDKLAQRVQFHITKISLVTAQLQDGLLRDMAVTLDRIDRNVERIGRDVADLHGVLVTGLLQPTTPVAMTIPVTLAMRFNNALMASNRPLSFADPNQIPLLEGFDALVYHFSQSTVRSHGPPGSSQPLDQYINLVKAQWLLQALKQTAEYEQSCYYKRAILRMEQLIRDESCRSDLTRYPEADFDRVNAASYAIWPVDELTPDSGVDDGYGQDEQILELPLRDVPGALTVFRMSDTELRLVRPTAGSASGLPSRDREIEINVHSHLFEPVYASPWSLDPTCQVQISSSQVRSATLYDFKEMASVYAFQQAVTGFKVVHDRVNVQWSRDKKKRNEKARVQIWQYKPLPQSNATASPSSPNSPTGSLDSGFSAGPTKTVAESMTEGVNPSIFSIVRNPASGRANDRESVILERVPLPVLVMFTVVDKQRTFFQLELDNSISINPQSCECRHASNSCRQVVIENRPGSRSSLQLRMLSESEGSSTKQPWDLSILGLPRHPLFTKRVKSAKVPYLALTFPSIEEKEQFIFAFVTISRLRNKDEYDYVEAKKRFIRRANTPNANAIEPLRRASTASTITPTAGATSRTMSFTPTLDSMSFEVDGGDAKQQIFEMASY